MSGAAKPSRRAVWRALWADMHRRALETARAVTPEMVDCAQVLIYRALERGWSLEQFQRIAERLRRRHFPTTQETGR